MTTPIPSGDVAPMPTVGAFTSAEAISGLFDLVGAREPVLDTTFGSGMFWVGSTRKVWGMDKNHDRARHLCASFLALPFGNGSVPSVVFDPPFHPFVGSAEEERFSGLGCNERELKTLFQAGVAECWRVTGGHLFVKCQGYIHNHSPQWMPLWAIQVCGEPFEWLTATRQAKRVSGRWGKPRSLRRVHSDYLVFSKHGNKR